MPCARSALIACLMAMTACESMSNERLRPPSLATPGTVRRSAEVRAACASMAARTGPWKTVEDLELATLGWVHWHNHERLHGYLGDVPPVEFENAFYGVQTDRELPVGIK